MAVARPAYAQCTSNASSCVTCHETQGLRPVLQSAQPWHVDHGFGDLCASCHAGDPGASAKEQAHLGMRQPLADPAVSCAGCHADDSAARAERYLAVPASTVAPPPTSPPASSPSVAGALSTADRILAALAALLMIALYFVVRRELAAERRSFPRGCVPRLGTRTPLAYCSASSSRSPRLSVAGRSQRRARSTSSRRISAAGSFRRASTTVTS